MRIVPTALYLPVTYDDDITSQLTNCDGNYKFSVYPYTMLQEFVIDSVVIVTGHHEIMRKSRAWNTSFSRVLKRFALMTDELDI